MTTSPTDVALKRLLEQRDKPKDEQDNDHPAPVALPAKKPSTTAFKADVGMANWPPSSDGDAA